MTGLSVCEIRQVAQQVARDVIASGAIEADRAGVFPAESVRALAERGLFGLLVPEEHDGAGLGFPEVTAVAETVASACPATALILVAHAATCATLATSAGSALRERLLGPLAAGDRLAGFAVHEESSGCMPTPIKARATRHEGGFRVTARKPFVTAAGHVDVFVLLAELENAGPSLFVVERGEPGLATGSPEAALGLRGAAVAELVLEDFPLPPNALLGAGGDGLSILGATIGTVGRFGVAGAALGIAKAVQAAMSEHIRNRKAAGVDLDQHGAVVAAAASVTMMVDAIGATLSRHLAQAGRVPELAPILAARAKLHATDGAVDVARTAMQVCGGHAYFGAGSIERHLRDALGFTVHLGPSAQLRDHIGRAELSSMTA